MPKQETDPPPHALTPRKMNLSFPWQRSRQTQQNIKEDEQKAVLLFSFFYERQIIPFSVMKEGAGTGTMCYGVNGIVADIVNLVVR